MVDAQEAGSKLLSKHRWRTKIFNNDDDTPKPPKAKHVQSFKLNDDVNDFLKPSTERAQQQKEAAAAAFLSHSSSTAKPRIDVAKAQRWPAANDILNSAAASGKSPGIGGLKTGTRKKGLTVSFVRTRPDVIGHGGDECEEPSIEVYRRRKANSVSDMDKLQALTHDDMNVGTRSPKFNGMNSTNQEASERGIVTRTLTSHGEMSPPLQKKLEMGQINTHANPPPPPPQRMGPMGLGDRPKPLTRAPTGFDLQLDTSGRPSMDSTVSPDSDGLSPVSLKKTPSLATTLEEEESSVPQQLKRSQTGWSEHAGDSDNESIPAIPRLAESEPSDPHSFSARVMHKMRAEEGRALHEAAQRAHVKQDSDDSTNSFQTGPVQRQGTPPQSFAAFSAGRTPPRLPSSRDTHRRQSGSPQRGLDAEDPQRSRARGPSPGRRPMPPGTFPLDTDQRPESSSSASQYSGPGSAASRNRGSPTAPSTEPFSAVSVANSIQQTPSTMEKAPFSALSQSSIVPIQPQFEQRPSYSSSPQIKQSPPPPPPHIQDPRAPPPRPRQTPTAAAPPASGGLSRSDTRMQNDLAFKDFAERVTHMKSIFQLTAQLGGQINDYTPTQWLRVATWWFLKGRVGMENLIRNRPKSGDPQPERLTQPHVDLAKAWWILNEIIPNHPSLRHYSGPLDVQVDLARAAGDAVSAEAYEIGNAILHYMRLLVGSMKKHQSMPPTAALIQGQDQSIWEEYPKYAPDAAAVLSGSPKSMVANAAGQLSLSHYIPVADTKADFTYFRMFAKVHLSTDDPNTDRLPIPVVVTVLRPKEEYQMKLSICSQNELVNIVVGSNPDTGPTWRDVSWKKSSRQLCVGLRHGFMLTVELSEGDWRSVWAIVDHTNRVESNLRERSDERYSCKLYLREASYKDPANPAVFPSDRISGCKLLVFEKYERSSEGTGKRKLHRGYRLVLVTAQKTKQLSYVTHEMGNKQEPTNFEYITEADQAPAMRLHFREETPDKKARMCSMHLVFNDSKDRNILFGTFTSMNIAQGEMVFAQVPLKNFSIESADSTEAFSGSGSRVLEKLQWQEAKTMNQDPEAAGLEAAPTVMSESLRIVCRHSAGIVADRMNLGPGELLVRLPNDGAAQLSLLREPQQDLSVAIDGGRTDKDIPEALSNLLKTLTSASTIRKLTFNSFKDLHTFQLAVTGFKVKFDGIASTFSISRRRMVVPIYKQWTANTIRLQIVEQDNIVQLLAFFEDFSHADAMNFQLKSMDVFEKVDKGGKASLRLVDAKFALPVEERKGEGKMGKEEGKLTGWAGTKRRFVCLDQIEYPGEHDDILIGFDSTETRDRFAEALPAATQVERKFTVRRKI